MKIRKYQEKDKKNLQYICIATAKPTNSEKQKELLTTLYNDYFTECESENVFVAANDDDDAIGYILCSTDFKKYRKTMKKDYMPKVWKLNKSKWLLTQLEFIIETHYAKRFPAFLHIDILDGYQRQGLGHKLMDALMSHLREKGVPSVMLGVSADNEKGINFYKKYGFYEVIRGMGICKMAYDVPQQQGEGTQSV
ncbi:MAG: GNAT family N-acetyltransferase [Clostridia bacterium]|nr:GNAT family N-acetyltransferase [Clostridia bacterium]